MICNICALYEYNEENGSVHMNDVQSVIPLLLDHRPNTNGYRPVCWIDDELKDDADFLEYRYSFCHKGLSYDDFAFAIQTWLKDHYPQKQSIWEVTHEQIRNCNYRIGY